MYNDFHVFFKENVLNIRGILLVLGRNFSKSQREFSCKYIIIMSIPYTHYCDIIQLCAWQTRDNKNNYYSYPSISPILEY